VKAKEPLCRLVRFEAADGVELSGLLYEPKRRSGRAAVFLHGNGGASIFDSRRTNLLAESFLAAGIAFLPFNNRGAHLLRSLKRARRRKRVQGGMAHEVIRDCVHDIDGALRELRRRGYREFTLIGHSTGANKIAVYDHYRPRNRVKRYVLLAGGDDTGLLFAQLGPRRFASALAKARERIRARRGAELTPLSISRLPLSWRSFYDLANPDGDYNVFPYLEAVRGIRLSRRPLFRHVRAIRKPALVLYGDRDPFLHGDVSTCVSVLAALAPPKFELGILAGADHGFGGHEEELGRLIVEWMS
jgi:pimeloyl-ACP methyl ester carboxylesterase